MISGHGHEEERQGAVNEGMLHPLRRFELLFGDAGPKELTQALAQELLARIGEAEKVLSDTLARQASGPLSAETEILHSVFFGLRDAAQALLDRKQASTQHVAIQDAVRECFSEIIAEIQDDRAQVSQLLAFVGASLSDSLASRWTKAIATMREALTEGSVSSLESLRDIRGALLEVAQAGAGGRPEVAWMAYAAVCWALSFGMKDIQQSFANGWKARSDVGDVVSQLFARLYACHAERDGELVQAYQLSLRAVQMRSDPAALLQAACAAVKSGTSEEARGLLEPLFNRNPVYALLALGEPTLARVRGAMVELAIRAQVDARKSAQGCLEAWNRSLDKIEHVERQVEMRIDIPHALSEARKKLSEGMASADLFRAGYIRLRSQTAAREVLIFAQRQLEDEMYRREQVAATAKASVAKAWEQREQEVNKAAERQHEELKAAKGDLQVHYDRADKRQATATRFFSIGCGSFVLYLLAAAVCTYKGLEAGLTSKWGIAAMILAGAPSLMAVWIQIRSATQRSAIDATWASSSAHIRAVFNQRVKEADRRYHHRIESYREQLACAEKEKAKAQQALLLLNDSAQAA